MIWRQFLSRQSRRPSGILGRMLIGRYLDRVNRKSNRLAYETLAHEPDARVLEIGFGGGELLFRIARGLGDGRIDGVDVSAEMVERANLRARRLGLERVVGFHLGGVETLPFEDAAFDNAVSVHTIYFWPDLHAGIGELARVIKPGGKLVLAFSSPSELRDDGWVERGFRAYSEAQVAVAYRDHGFEPQATGAIRREGRGQVYALCGTRS